MLYLPDFLDFLSNDDMISFNFFVLIYEDSINMALSMKVLFMEVVLLFIKMALYVIKMALLVIKMALLVIKMVTYAMDTNSKGSVFIFWLGIHMNNVGLYSFFILVQQLKLNGFAFDYLLCFQFILAMLIFNFILVSIFLLMFLHFLLNLVRNEFHEHKLQIIARRVWVSNLFEAMSVFSLFFQFIFENWILFILPFLSILIPFMRFFWTNYSFFIQQTLIEVFWFMMNILHSQIFQLLFRSISIYLAIHALTFIQYH